MEKTSDSAVVLAQRAVYEASRLQPGDLLDIKVTAYDEHAVRPFNLHSMNQANSPNPVLGNQVAQVSPVGYIVDQEGYIVFPVLGKMHVEGMTKEQLRDRIEQSLLTYLSDPLVSIRQLNFNVTVLGEVRKPGQYTSPTEKISVFQALGLAGDMTEYANRTNVMLVRDESGNEQTVYLDFTDKNLISSPYYYLRQNDVLYVQPDEIRKKSANIDPNRNLAFQIGGIAVAVASLLLTIFR